MNNARLLHAAARGARIQYKPWEKFNDIALWLPSLNSKSDYRIHPEDEHLAYGPISTALLYYAEHGEWPKEEDRTARRCASVLLMNECVVWTVHDRDGPHVEFWYALFLAEALADEGL